MSVAICSFVSGPRRNDIAQRVEKSSALVAVGALEQELALLEAADRRVERRDVDRRPPAERRPSSTRSLSRSVWRRPTNQLPAFAIAL